jgi:hypothetical protein
MALVEAPEERKIVVLRIGGIGETIVQDRLRMLPNQGLHGREADVGRFLLLHGGHQIIEEPEQLISTPLLATPVVFQGNVPLVMDATEAFNKHLAQVIQGLCDLPVDECGGERRALGRGQTLHARRIEAQDCRGKLLDLDGREGRQGTRPHIERCEPLQPRDEMAQLRERWSSWIRLDLIPEGLPCRRVGGEELVQPLVTLGIDRLSDLLKERAVHGRPHTLGRSPEGGKPGELPVLADQFLDPHIDEIGKIILGLRGVTEHRLEGVLGVLIIRLDMQMRSDSRHMASARPRGIIGTEVGRLDRRPHVGGQVLHNRGGDLLHVDKIAQPLKGLQENEETHRGGGTPCQLGSSVCSFGVGV